MKTPKKPMKIIVFSWLRYIALCSLWIGTMVFEAVSQNIDYSNLAGTFWLIGSLVIISALSYKHLPNS